jgi:uncharacterized RDD family membrane protein YckC
MLKWNRYILVAFILCLCCSSAGVALAQSDTPSTNNADVDSIHASQARHHWHRRHADGDETPDGDQLVSIGHDSHLPAGSHADSVVAVFGAAYSEGEARDVVSVLGETRVTGPVQEDAVAVIGSTYVNSRIGGNAVAVLGDVELGPNADVGGDAVAVGGTITRDPASIVHGETQAVFPGHFRGFEWLRPWVRECLMYGRPLALESGVGWAWYLALFFLAFYLLLAFVFRSGVQQCVQTFDTHPGPSVVAALLTILLSPIVLVLLCITVIGIAAIPFVVVGIFCAGVFGKAVMLAWIGQRCLGRRRVEAMAHPALAVLIGGAIVLLLYLVPILGFVVYKLLGLLGLGAVVYTLILAMRSRQATRAAATAAAGAAPLAAQPASAAPSTAPSADAGPARPSAPDTAATTAAATPVIAATLPRAGFWIRIAALTLDALLVGILIGLLHHLFHLELVLLATYGAIMWKLRGSTIGGIVFDLQVVRQDGRELDWPTAIVRALGCFLSLAAAGLGFIWIAFDAGKQAWHDKIAGTVVVRVAKGVSLL